MRRGEVVEVTVARLGHEGDGIAEVEGTRLFVPFALPGERWRVRVEEPVYGGHRTRPLARLAGTAARAEPFCPRFGRCGGCRLQHLEAEAQARFKRERILEELARRRVTVEVLEPVWTSPPASRRRLRLAWSPGRRGRLPRLGFHRRHSRRIEPVDHCPVARPEIDRLLGPLAEMLAESRVAACPVYLAVAANGVDIALLTTWEAPPALWGRWETFAGAHGVARVALGAGIWAETLVRRTEPWVAVGDLRVPLPPAAFLQATEEGERALVDFVGEAIRDGDRVVDLHAGLGVLTLPHHQRLRRLELVDRDRNAQIAVVRALEAVGDPRLSYRVRDLEHAPLTPQELAAFDLVVLDPPRAGARAQCEAIARSRLGRVVYVSCNPATFARDARILADAGFRLARLRPVDQFVGSAEVELAALFLRGSADG